MVLVTGSNGQLGSGFLRFFERNGIEACGIDREQLDITNQDKTIEYITGVKPACVFHCAAYSNVNLAEEEKENCERINVIGTENITNACKAVGSKIVYISTDYVFDGTKGEPYDEMDDRNPLSVYGITKAHGEDTVLKYEKSFVVRIAWLFGKNGNNFVDTMIRLGQSNKEVTVVCDQIGSPTYVEDIVPLLYKISCSEKYGIYHATNEGYCSWADLAEKIMEYSNTSCTVKRVLSKEYGAKVTRPLDSRLSKAKLYENGFGRLPHWENALVRYLQKENR